MSREFDEEKLTRYLDGDLSPEERKLLEVFLEGDRQALRKLHALMRVRDAVRSLPRPKCPVDLVPVMRDFRRREEERKRPSLDRTFFGFLARAAAVAAVLLAVLIAVIGSPVRPGGKAPLVAFSPLPDVVSSPPNAMKVGGESRFDIFDRRFSPTLNGSVGGLEIRAARKLDLSPLITVRIEDWGPGTAKLRAALAESGVTPVFLPGYGRPVYRLKISSGDTLRSLVANLKDSVASFSLGDELESVLAAPRLSSCPSEIFLAVDLSTEEK
ncbi:MAG: hypothetical protein DRP90_03545 [Planctomycetota bacterium]|nr:MAG: hypothetical protein DRP90_03545 [Planctomycetota bacterium]